MQERLRLHPPRGHLLPLPQESPLSLPRAWRWRLRPRPSNLTDPARRRHQPARASSTPKLSRNPSPTSSAVPLLQLSPQRSTARNKRRSLMGVPVLVMSTLWAFYPFVPRCFPAPSPTRRAGPSSSASLPSKSASPTSSPPVFPLVAVPGWPRSYSQASGFPRAPILLSTSSSSCRPSTARARKI
jgi:hypothetical protein